jgi:hypothetical protein
MEGMDGMDSEDDCPARQNIQILDTEGMRSEL